MARREDRRPASSSATPTARRSLRVLRGRVRKTRGGEASPATRLGGSRRTSPSCRSFHARVNTDGSNPDRLACKSICWCPLPRQSGRADDGCHNSEGGHAGVVPMAGPVGGPWTFEPMDEATGILSVRVANAAQTRVLMRVAFMAVSSLQRRKHRQAAGAAAHRSTIARISGLLFLPNASPR
jgi:hypothetical protein